MSINPIGQYSPIAQRRNLNEVFIDPNESDPAFLDPVTKDPFSMKILITSCGHSFNETTIKQLTLTGSHFCPSCRGSLHEKQASNLLARDLLIERAKDQQLMKAVTRQFKTLLVNNKDLTVHVQETVKELKQSKETVKRLEAEVAVLKRLLLQAPEKPPKEEMKDRPLAEQAQ